MSGPTRQRSFRERLHGIGMPWQGKKSASAKDGQTVTETEKKSGVQDSRSCDPIPTCYEDPSSDTSAADASQKKEEEKSPPPTKTEEEQRPKLEEKSMEKKALSRSFTQPKGTEEYQVKASDTLAGIAARFDTTPSELAKLNRLTTRLIFPGQLLFVPEKKAAATTSTDDTAVENADKQKEVKDSSEQIIENKRIKQIENEEKETGQRKASLADPLRIPYRRPSMQRFLKVKARHFTDGQGVVTGVLIITPNAVMFDPNVSDPLVIEHGTESYGVIAPLDMVMRTAIYFDIAHMKVKHAPEAQFNIPKPDVYYGKMKISESNEDLKNEAPGGVRNKTSETTEVIERKDESADNQSASTQTPSEVREKSTPKETEDKVSEEAFKDATEVDAVKTTTADNILEAETQPGPTAQLENILVRETSIDSEVMDAFADNIPLRSSSRGASGEGSIDSPTPPPFFQSSAEGGDKPAESRRERMLKRLSYPMESITSYTQSSISRILSSSPKSFVDFSSGLFVRTAEEDKAKEGGSTSEPPQEKRSETPQEEHKEASRTSSTESQPQKEPQVTENIEAATPEQKEEKPDRVVGYKNLVDEKPELFAVLDKLLSQNVVREQEGPPLYLCLRMGHPKEKKRSSTPILSYGKKRAKSEYWFSIPYNRVEDLYNFLQQWIPQLYGDVNEVDPETLGFNPIDDSTEDEEEEEEEIEAGEDQDDEKNKKSSPRSFLKLVEDHFGFRSISPTDWEVLSMSEADKIPYSDLELPLPELLSPSEIFREEHVKNLYTLLPARAVGYPWTLIFSTSVHGFNLRTLYRNMSNFDTPILLAMTDTEGAVFGALLSSALKPSDSFYGTGESFLYTFHPEFKVFKWTGANLYFIKGNADSVAIGAGDGQFGIWLDEDLNHGRSKKCQTFDNDILSVNEDFIISALEAWGFV